MIKKIVGIVTVFGASLLQGDTTISNHTDQPFYVSYRLSNLAPDTYYGWSLFRLIIPHSTVAIGIGSWCVSEVMLFLQNEFEARYVTQINQGMQQKKDLIQDILGSIIDEMHKKYSVTVTDGQGEQFKRKNLLGIEASLMQKGTWQLLDVSTGALVGAWRGPSNSCPGNVSIDSVGSEYRISYADSEQWTVCCNGTSVGKVPASVYNQTGCFPDDLFITYAAAVVCKGSTKVGFKKGSFDTLADYQASSLPEVTRNCRSMVTGVSCNNNACCYNVNAHLFLPCTGIWS